MSRRFQFSLRALLVVTAVVCLLLGSRHLLETYGNRIEVIEAVPGKPISVNGRYFRVFGPAQSQLVVAGRPAGDDAIEWTHEFAVERSWLCCYDFQGLLLPEEAGELSLDMGRWIRAPEGWSNLVVIKSKTVKVSAQ